MAAWETIQEYVNSRGVELAADAEHGVIRGVKILGTSSHNGRTYAPEAINKAAGLYEGAKVNVNHPRDKPNDPRDYRDRIGRIAKVRIREDGLYGDLHFNPKHALAEQLIWDANNAPENVGLSHNVQARVRGRNGQQVVEEIYAVQSVDLVADPATTHGLFEHTLIPETKENDMELKDLSITEIRAARPDLVEAIQAETKTAITESEEAKSKAANFAAALKKITALTEENDTLKAANDLRDRMARTAELLEQAKLPKELVTDIFKAQLAEADEEGAKALIEDRRELAKHMNVQHPTSKAQIDTGTPMEQKGFLAAVKK